MDIISELKILRDTSGWYLGRTIADDLGGRPIVYSINTEYYSSKEDLIMLHGHLLTKAL